MAIVTSAAQAETLLLAGPVGSDYYSTGTQLRDPSTLQVLNPQPTAIPSTGAVLDITDDFSGTATDNSYFSSVRFYVPGSAADPNGAKDAALAQPGYLGGAFSGNNNDGFAGTTALFKIVGFNSTTPTNDPSIPVGSLVVLEPTVTYFVDKAGVGHITDSGAYAEVDFGTTSLEQLNTDQNAPTPPTVTLGLAPFSVPEPSAAFMLPVFAAAVLGSRVFRARKSV